MNQIAKTSPQGRGFGEVDFFVGLARLTHRDSVIAERLVLWWGGVVDAVLSGWMNEPQSKADG